MQANIETQPFFVAHKAPTVPTTDQQDDLESGEVDFDKCLDEIYKQAIDNAGNELKKKVYATRKETALFELEQ